MSDSKLAKVLVVLAGVLHSAAASAAAWTPPTNVRIVQKNNDSGGGVYTSIHQAIQECPGTAAEQCVVKVMPGTYDVGAGLVMKQYVDVVGSGRDATIVTASTRNADDAATTCTTGAVTMANDSALRDLTIVNTAPATTAGRTITAAVAFPPGVTTGLVERVGLESGPATGGGYPVGACAGGNAPAQPGLAQLKDVDVRVRANRSSAAVKVVGGGSAAIAASRLVVESTGGTIDVINENNPAPGTITVDDSTLQAKDCPFQVGIYGGANAVSVTNSRIVLSAATAVGFESHGTFTMRNTVITGPATTEYSIWGDSTISIANSQLPGGNLAPWAAGLFNNYDELLRAIPNQPLPPPAP